MIGRIAMLGALAVAIAGLIVVVWPGERGNGPTPAFAAPLVRFARSTPQVLLQISGWHVAYADEEPDGLGQLNFVRGPSDDLGDPRGVSFSDERGRSGRVGQLNWQPLTATERRYIESGHQHLATGLGVIAKRLTVEGTGKGWLDLRVDMIDGNRQLYYRATVTNMARFRAQLRALHTVDTTTWLRAMPASVITTMDSGQTIHAMLAGVPLPPHFDAARIRGAQLVHNRYQLGADVTGTVACMWFADWNRARIDGDTAMVERAVAAMATAPSWPVLRQRAQQGGWTQVLVGYAKAMPSGKWYGRPLIGELNGGLGCADLGVKLEP